MVYSARHKKSLTIEEVIEGVFADRDLENEYSESQYGSEAETETETEEESEEDESGEQITGNARQESNNANGQDNIRRGMASIGQGVRTRGGLRNAVQKRLSKQQEQVMLKKKWKMEDRAPNIPPFTGASQINIDLPKDATPFNFLDLFLDDEFYEHFTFQKNLYAAQYIAAHDILPRYSSARYWKKVTVDEMKQYLALYLLTGIIKKPGKGQYWSTSSVIKTDEK